MNNAELIEEKKLKQKKIIAILRHCGSHKGCNKCPLAGKSADACMKILLDSADALEAAEKRIAELEKQDSVEMHKKQVARIAELEAQVPKEGEWEEQELAPKNYRFCTQCGFANKRKSKWNYCPNCGAKMDEKENADADS